MRCCPATKPRGRPRIGRALAPDEVLVRRDGAERVVPVDEIGVGEIVVVRPGERLAAGGGIVDGQTTVNEAPVTGEVVPVEKGPGGTVFSGSLNGSRGLLVRPSRSAERIVQQNVAVSILIKGLFVLLAPFGLVALWLAVLADMGTSIAVTLNGLRLFRRGRV